MDMDSTCVSCLVYSHQLACLICKHRAGGGGLWRYDVIDVCVAKNGCVRAKRGLTGQLDRRQPGNYFKPCCLQLCVASTGNAD